MKKRFVVILVVATILVSGTLFYINEVKNYNTSLIAKPEVIEKIIPIARVSTDGWKTCRNEALGYEFKYPSDWKLYNNVDTETIKIQGGTMTQGTSTDRCIGNVSVSSFIQTGGPNGPRPKEEEKNNYFSVEVGGIYIKATTTDDLVHQLQEITAYENTRVAPEARQTFDTNRRYVLDGVSFALVQYYDSKGSPSYWRLLLVNDKKSIVEIRTSYFIKTIKDIPAVNETILSTFKFIK